MEEDIKCWKQELEHAKKKCDNEYESYCVDMIEFFESILSGLKEIYNKYLS